MKPGAGCNQATLEMQGDDQMYKAAYRGTDRDLLQSDGGTMASGIWSRDTPVASGFCSRVCRGWILLVMVSGLVT